MRDYFAWLPPLLPPLVTGCYRGEEREDGLGNYTWDFISYNIYSSVEDAAGTNLLNPQVSSDLLANEIVMGYEDKTFPLENSADTRFNMPRSLGSRKELLGKEKERVLSFGRFPPEHQYRGEISMIHWKDGTKDAVKFDLCIT